jgi:catechol 2,3-dioxygenase-like lactoylglutathione lyase family enzyme
MPRRLGHTLLFTPDQASSTAFYMDVLGLAVTDRITGKVTFLNAGPGDHHVFGFITSTHPGFHHASYEVRSIDAIGFGAQRMRSTGYAAGWGLGRHTVGSNFFHYTQDPWAAGSSGSATSTRSGTAGSRGTGTSRRTCGARPRAPEPAVTPGPRRRKLSD